MGEDDDGCRRGMKGGRGDCERIDGEVGRLDGARRELGVRFGGLGERLGFSALFGRRGE